MLILFLFLQRGLKHLFPPASVKIQLSEDSVKAFRRYRLRHTILLVLATLLLTVLFTLIFRYGLSYLHSRGDWLIHYAVNTVSLVLPSLLMGVLGAYRLVPWIMERWQKDGLAFFMEDLLSVWEGWNRQRLLGWHQLLVGLVALGLYLSQALVFFKADQERICYSTTGKAAQEVSREQVQELTSSKPPLLILKNGDTIDMGHYHYRRRELIMALP